jgi:glycosyltransferase involved in cell wall biosynthesis
MRVAFELTVLELDAAGTARAVGELAAALRERDDVQLVPVAHPRRRRSAGRLVRGLDRELRWMPFSLPRRARRLEADLLHCPAALGPARGAGPPMVVTINDVLALEHPRWFSLANAAQQRLLVGRLARRAAAVCVPSGHTRTALVERTGADPARVHVVPYGVGPPFTPGAPDEGVLARFGVRRPYALTVATLQPRKNLEAVLAAHQRLDLQLVVAGGRGWRDEALAARLRDARGVVLTGRVEDAELVALLRGAAMLVHPSRHEGFGFPPLEAMACGTPVVAARAASLPELVGDAGALVDVDEPGRLAAAMARALDDGDRLRERGLARAAELTWAACAERTAAVYRAALAG